MQNEVVSCPLQSFVEAYRPFKPTQEELSACVNALEQHPSLLLDGNLVERGDPPSQQSESEGNLTYLVGEIAKRLECVDLDAANASGSKNIEPELNGIATKDKAFSHARSESNCRRHHTAQWTFGPQLNRAIPDESEDCDNKVDGYFSRIVPEWGALSLGDVSVLCMLSKSKEGKEAIEVS